MKLILFIRETGIKLIFSGLFYTKIMQTKVFVDLLTVSDLRLFSSSLANSHFKQTKTTQVTQDSSHALNLFVPAKNTTKSQTRLTLFIFHNFIYSVVIHTLLLIKRNQTETCTASSDMWNISVICLTFMCVVLSHMSK